MPLQIDRQRAKKIFRGQSNHMVVQFIRYGFVVAIAFPIDFGLLYIFTDKLHIHYLQSAILAFSISMFVNYLLSIRWVFTGRTEQARWAEGVSFAIIGFVGLGLTAIFIWLFTDLLGFQYLISKLIAVMFVFFWSFGARRFIFQQDVLDWLKRLRP